jgi:tRNA-binding protein
MKKDLSTAAFEQIEMRTGTIVSALPFPEARKAAYKLFIDFGPHIGVLKSSAQITDNYTLEELIGMQVVAVVNFPDKQIGPFTSQCLVLAATNSEGKATLLSPLQPVQNGERVH